MISFSGSGRTGKSFGDLLPLLLFHTYDWNLIDVSLGKA